ncbi:uncharacterized protein LOC124880997 isoform X2 [Girardinichthys multiradiatus]|uniref:uncharacterized protein LOC124880997 isoform X2 n=1 Tax=Girardinichthys multiradiatus TaxID=208333 RepID=UPI001FAE2FC9|nr:uncharacterized protein LOC124880997 isoform X2 [Girardinichthys multiradiatus]
MKLLLRSLLLSSLCALSSWSVSSDTLVVTQSPDVSFHEGETGNISCCWKEKNGRVNIKWLKNQTLVENKTVINQSTSSQNKQANSCSVLIFPNFAIRDSGRYICKVTVEIPMLLKVEGNGTTITVTARTVIPDHHNLNEDKKKTGQAARVIYKVSNTDSFEAEMDKHSTGSSRGSTQWCEVAMYDYLDYFERVETKGSK